MTPMRIKEVTGKYFVFDVVYTGADNPIHGDYLAHNALIIFDTEIEAINWVEKNNGYLV